MYHKRKPYQLIFERSFETECIITMECSRQLLVVGVLFQCTCTKTNLEPSMAKIRPVSKLLSKEG